MREGWKRKHSRLAWKYCVLIAALCRCVHAEETPIEVDPPYDFIRDVMQPLGMPMVSTYHAIRENFFLNTRTKGAHPVESIGNFFLIPSQYLFGGKKIAVNDLSTSNLEVYSPFHYDKGHWLKTAAYIVVLPVSEVLGATFKGISYLWPEVRRKNRAIKRALRSSYVRSHVEEYRQKGLPPLHCEEFIPCQGHLRPSSLTKRQKLELQALKEVIELLETNNIVYWIDCGTCLGAYRYGGIIPWDWDIDLSILMPDHENVKKLLSNLDPKKYQIQDWSSYSKPKSFLKLYVKETKNFVDIYHYQINEEEQTVNYFYSYIDSPFPHSWKKEELKFIKPIKYQDLFPLKRAKFDRLIVWAPNNVVAFLQTKYGENLDPVMVWDENNKTYMKVEDHPYYQ